MLECRIIGNPKPVVTWYKGDNVLIRDSPNYIYLDEANCTYKLVIRESNLDDSGNYKVCASNHFGQSVSLTRLVVNEGIDFLDFFSRILDFLNFKFYSKKIIF